MSGIGIAPLQAARSALLDALGRGFMRFDFGHGSPFVLNRQKKTKIDHDIGAVKEAQSALQAVNFGGKIRGPV